MLQNLVIMLLFNAHNLYQLRSKNVLCYILNFRIILISNKLIIIKKSYL